MKSLSCSIGAIFACGPLLSLVSASASPLLIDFEAPLYKSGSIHGQNGWTVEQGLAEVDDKAGQGGGGAHRG